MYMEPFVIKPYTKKELALCYFPDSDDPRTAVKRLRRWIHQCQPLMNAMHEAGYYDRAQWLSPRMVSLIVEYLGEP